jgi:hypothetical protein
LPNATNTEGAADQRSEATCRRRTRRLGLTVGVEVSGKDANNASFTAIATVTNLNRHGAMLTLNRELSLQSMVVIKTNRGTRTSARVVAQKTAGARYAYGIELVDTDSAKDFWGIVFPISSQIRR